MCACVCLRGRDLKQFFLVEREPSDRTTVHLAESFVLGIPVKAGIQAMMRKVPLDLPCNEMLQAISFMKL